MSILFFNFFYYRGVVCRRWRIWRDVYWRVLGSVVDRRDGFVGVGDFVRGLLEGSVS